MTQKEGHSAPGLGPVAGSWAPPDATVRRAVRAGVEEP